MQRFDTHFSTNRKLSIPTLHHCTTRLDIGYLLFCVYFVACASAAYHRDYFFGLNHSPSSKDTNNTKSTQRYRIKCVYWLVCWSTGLEQYYILKNPYKVSYYIVILISSSMGYFKDSFVQRPKVLCSLTVLIFINNRSKF